MKILLPLVFLMIFLFVPLAQTHTITVPTNAYFGFETGCYINFSTEQTFDNIYRESNYWYFDDYGFHVQNANMTITDFFLADKLVFTLSAPSGTITTTKVYVGDKGEPKAVSGATSWNYDSVSKILTITALHSSSVTIIVRWKLLGDINDDGTVDTSDLIELNKAFGSTGGPPPSDNWNPSADLNQDNNINISDLYILGKNYGKTF